MPQGCFRPLEARKRQSKLFSSTKKGFLGPRNKVFCVFWPSRGQKWPPFIKYKKPQIWKEFFCILCQKVIFGLWWPVNGKRKDFRVHGIRFFAFFGLQRPKMTPTHKTQKNPNLKRFFLYLMPKGHIWTLVASKRQKKGFSGPRNKVCCVLWPPEDKNDPHSENTKKTLWKESFEC